MDYDEVAEHMSQLDAALAEVDALRHKLADAEMRARLASDLLERMGEDLASEKRLRQTADDAWIAWRERAEAAEAALSELRQKLEWWGI